MLTGEDVMEIRVLWRQGLSIREIARRTGRSRNTVRTHLRSDSSDSPLIGSGSVAHCLVFLRVTPNLPEECPKKCGRKRSLFDGWTAPINGFVWASEEGYRAGKAAHPIFGVYLPLGVAA